jgi:hypothetical protein
MISRFGEDMASCSFVRFGFSLQGIPDVHDFDFAVGLETGARW